MAAIDKDLLAKAMDKSGVTATHIASHTGKSLTYVCDIIAGRRTLKRNPELRRAIADSMDVPVHWIEHHSPDVAT